MSQQQPPGRQPSQAQIALFLVAMLLTGRSTAKDESKSFTLQYKFKPGEVLRVDVQHQAAVDVTIKDSNQTTQTKSGDMHEVWGVLPAVAAVTQDVRVGTLVSPTTMHHPAMLPRRCSNIGTTMVPLLRNVHARNAPANRLMGFGVP